MDDPSPSSDLGDLIDSISRDWHEAVCEGVLPQHVIPAVGIHAYASLHEIDDPPDAAICFPPLRADAELADHYRSALSARLVAACASIQSALQTMRNGLGLHSAIAACRRANESLWKAFWLCNPELDGATRIHRLLILMRHELNEVLGVFSQEVNSAAEIILRRHERDIRQVTGKDDYRPRLGRDEYLGYIELRADDPLTPRMPPVPDGVDGGAVVWSIMSNLTHPNLVFDWIMMTQDNPDDLMERLQLASVGGAMTAVANISTIVMRQAQIPEHPIAEVSKAFRGPIFAAGFHLLSEYEQAVNRAGQV
ncbi:hypothetical protein [Candidatus Poriferisodalis sp.]|uniref:hypothetical protein n=1 Tax=Candidatus Poriferisodalis sp. TaxID=3101277 RepID=UPI003B52B08B